MAGVLYGLFHLIVEVDTGGGSMLDQPESIVFLFVGIPGLPVVAARQYVAGLSAAVRGDAARRGALIAGGYTAAMLVGTLVFEAKAGTGGMLSVRPQTVGLDPVTAALGAVVVSGAFGALGAVLAARDANWPFYVAVGLLSLPALLLLGASAG